MPALSELIPFAAAGLVAGLVLLWQGFGALRTAGRIEGTASSRLASIAAGEVRVSGTVEPAEVALVSALQSQRCVYYHSRISQDRGSRGGGHQALDEERAVGFTVSDGANAIRVFPRGASWDVPWRFAERDDWTASRPPGLNLRTGSAYTAAREDREAQIAALLTVRAADEGPTGGGVFGGAWGLASAAVGLGGTNHQRHYREARIEPGDTVTVLGRAVPFGTLDDPTHADLAVADHIDAFVEEDIAADIAEARAAGTLAPDAANAWGNAAIPGFGIGRPVSAPRLHEEADWPIIADAAEAAETERRFEISPETFVIVASTEVPLLIAAGVPGAAGERHQDRFLVGLLGAALAIVSAVVLALGLAATLP